VNQSYILKQFLSNRSALIELIVAAVLLALGVHLVADVVIGMGIPLAGVLVLGIFLVLSALAMLARKFVKANPVIREFQGVLAYRKSDNQLISCCSISHTTSIFADDRGGRDTTNRPRGSRAAYLRTHGL